MSRRLGWREILAGVTNLPKLPVVRTIGANISRITVQNVAVSAPAVEKVTDLVVSISKLIEARRFNLALEVTLYEA